MLYSSGFFLQHRKVVPLWLLASLYLFILIGCIACELSTKIIVKDFRYPVKLKADKGSSQTTIVRLQLKIKSNLTEPISIDLKSGDQSVREIHLQSGETTTMLIDWYTNQAEIAFIDNTQKEGSIEIEFEFVEI